MDDPSRLGSLAGPVAGLVAGLFVAFYVPLMVLTVIEDHVIHRTMLFGFVLFAPSGCAAFVGLRRVPAWRLPFLGMLAGSLLGAALALADAALAIMLPS